MEQLSARIRRLSGSQTIAMNQKSRDLQEKGVDVINLSVGEPDFPTPPHVKEAAKKAIDDNFSFYPPVAGFTDLKQAISRKFAVENNLEYSTDKILVTNGAKHALANALMCLVDEGDEVIIPAPYWVSYVELVKLAGGASVIIKSGIEDNFKIKPAQIEEAITSRTKILLLCSPNNPTGSVYTRGELNEISEILTRYPNIFVISDEIYEHINFTGKHESIAGIEEVHERVVVVNGVSKAYAMTGWRIGYLAASTEIVNACTKLQGQFTSGASTIAQKAAVAALSGDNSYTYRMKEAFLRRRDLVYELAKKVEGMKISRPQGAFYLFPDISAFLGLSFEGKKINDDNDFCLLLLENAHVAAVPGEAFGAPGFIRVSYATSDTRLTEAFARIEKLLKKLQ